MQPQSNHIFHFPSPHTSMTSVVHFNEARDMFVTAGEEGEINLYKIQDSREVKIGYAYAFNEVVVCLSWARCNVGSGLAIAGSKGSLVIFRVDRTCGIFQLSKCFTLQNTVSSLEWQPVNSRLLVGTQKGKVHFIQRVNGQWVISLSKDFKLNSFMHVACGLFSDYQPARFIGFGQIFGQIKIRQKLKENYSTIKQLDFQPHFKYQNQSILGLLAQNQVTVGSLPILVLTNLKLRIYTYQYKYKNKDQLQKQQFSDIKLLQQIQLGAQSFDRMNWGWSQDQAVLYSSNPLRKNVDTDKSTFPYNIQTIPPAIFKRKINGVWLKIQN